MTLTYCVYALPVNVGSYLFVISRRALSYFQIQCHSCWPLLYSKTLLACLARTLFEISEFIIILLSHLTNLSYALLQIGVAALLSHR